MGTVLICGARDYSDEARIEARLRLLPRDTRIIHGAQRGADILSGEIAEKLGFTDVVPFPAKWKTFGRAAGPIRNRQMLDECPALVIAFHKDISTSKGTRDCIKQAAKRGISVELIED